MVFFAIQELSVVGKNVVGFLVFVGLSNISQQGIGYVNIGIGIVIVAAAIVDTVVMFGIIGVVERYIDGIVIFIIVAAFVAAIVADRLDVVGASIVKVGRRHGVEIQLSSISVYMYV